MTISKILFDNYKQVLVAMSNQPTPGVFLEMAYNSNAFFQGSKQGDVCFRTAQSNQAILFGTQKDQPALFGIAGSNLIMRGNLAVGGQTSNPIEALDIRNGNAYFDSNVYVMNQVCIGGTNPSESLQIKNGNVKLGSNLYVIGRATIGITDSNPTETLDVNSNLKVRSNAYILSSISIGQSNPTEALDVIGNAKISSNIYAFGNIAVGTSNPTESLDVFNNAIVRSNAYVMRRVSVGKSNPVEALDVQGNSRVSGSLYVLTNTSIGSSNPTESLDVTNNTKLRGDVYALNKIVIGNGASNPTETLDVRGSSKVSSNLYVLNSIAVGSTNPTERLDVNGNAKVQGNLYTTNRIGVGNTNPGERIEVSGNILATSNVYAMANIGIGTVVPHERLETAGNIKCLSNVYVINNIAVGHSNPNEKLDVQGNAKVNGSVYASNRIGINTTSPSVGLEVNTTDSVMLAKGTTAQRPIMPQLGYVRYNTDTSQFEGFGAGNSWGSLGGVKSTNQSTYIAAEEYPGSNDDNLRFINSNNESMRITREGNVGIGTTTPEYKLDVNGLFRFKDPERDNYISFNCNDGWSGVKMNLSYSGNEMAIGMDPDNNDLVGFIKTFGRNNLTFGANGIERMRIDQYSGFVGINTTTPFHNLDVDGSISATGYCNLLLDTTSSESTSNAPTANALKQAADAAFYTSNVLFLGSGGSSVNAVAVSGSNTAYWASNNLVNKSGDTMTGTLYTPTIGVNKVSASEKLDVLGNIKATSNVYVMSRLGVGTSNPNVPVHVVGDMRVEGNLNVNGIYNTINTDVQVTDQFTVSNNGTGPALKVYQMGTQPIVDFYDDSNIAMRIADGGNVGIGTSNPSFKLDVSGTINASTYVGATITSLSNLGMFGSNTSVSASNTVISLSNYVYGTSTTSSSNAQLTASWASNVAYFGSNTSAWSSNNLLNKAGGTMTGNFSISQNIYRDIVNYDASWGDFSQFTIATVSNVVGSSTTSQLKLGVTNCNAGIGYIQTINPWVGVPPLVLQPSGGSVGIGMSNPSYKLDVNGTTRTSLLYAYNAIPNTPTTGTLGGTGDKVVLWPGSASTYPYSLGVANNTLWYSTPGTGQHQWYIGGTVGMTLSNNNLGIGTTTPSYMFDVMSTIDSNAVICVRGSTNTGGRLLLGNTSHGIARGANIGGASDGNDVTVHTAGGGSVTLASGGGEGLRVNPSANVGIGTTNPSYKLDVNGNIKTVSSSTTTGIIVQSSDVSTIIGSTVGTENFGTIQVMSGGSSTNVGSSPYHLNLQPNGGNIYTGVGLVGIGTKTPGYKLDVVSGDIVVRNGTNANDAGGALNFGISAYSNAAPMATIKGVLGNLDTTGNTLAGGITFNVRSNITPGGSNSAMFEAVRISAAGNVGIGTTSPGYKLDVQGLARVSSNVGQVSGTPLLQLVNGTSNMGFFINLPSGNYNGCVSAGDHAILAGMNAVDTASLVLGNWGNSNAGIKIDKSGNIGVGTGTPSYRLDVSGKARFASNVISQTAGARLQIADFDGTIDSSMYAIAQITQNSAGVSTWSNQACLAFVRSGNFITGLGFAQGSNVFGIGQGQGSSIAFTPSWLAINQSGNVGIGTTSPGYKMDVSGTLNATTIYQGGATLASTYLSIANGGTLSNALTIQEATGNTGNASQGTLTLKHNNSGGSSSIVFTSAVNAGSDYAYIRYQDQDNSTYFPLQTGTAECSRLTIGVENDTVDTNGETLVLKGAYGIVYDANRHFFTTGNVSIGSNDARGYKLYVQGQIYASDDITAFSDITAKSNLEIIHDPLTKIQQLNGYTYDMIKETPTLTKITPRYTGIIAQELEKVLPEAVHKDTEGKLSVAYGNLAGLFVECIKELTNQNKQLMQENQELKSDIQALSCRVAEIEKQIKM